jgi:Flp pilus assembly pilin Flp
MKRLWLNENGQDVAEYAIMLAVVLAVAIGVIKLIGSNLDPIWAGVASQISGGK